MNSALKIGFLVCLEVFMQNVYIFPQSKDELIFIMSNNMLIDDYVQNSYYLFKGETSELKLVFLGLIKFYQLFISSQDQDACNFTISCSRFAISAIKQYGIFHGLLIASDRIQRCNGLGRKYYPIDKDTGLSIDNSIEYYFIGKRRRKEDLKNE